MAGVVRTWIAIVTDEVTRAGLTVSIVADVTYGTFIAVRARGTVGGEDAALGGITGVVRTVICVMTNRGFGANACALGT